MYQAVIDYFEYYADPRTKDLLFVASPKPTLILVCIYLILVKCLLPMFMKNREAFKLKTAIFYYNLLQVILSAYIVYLTWKSGYGSRYSIFKCRDLERDELDPEAQMALKAVYVYFCSKFTEFLDTIFFVLRKKHNQVSFLHIYHHATMPLNAYMAVKLIPGGSVTLGAGTNSFIHVIMYTYYLLSGLGPKWQKYLWWKKYLTSFQLIQFVFGVWHVYMIIFGYCKNFKQYYPICVYGLLYIISLIFLFKNFYNRSYQKEKDSTNNNNLDNNKLFQNK